LPGRNSTAFTYRRAALPAGFVVTGVRFRLRPESAETIRARLEQQDRNQFMTDWVAKITKGFCTGGKIKYQAGYQPNPDPCTALATATNTTTT